MKATARTTLICLLGILTVLACCPPGLTEYTACAEKKKTVLEHADLVEGGQTPESSGKVEPFRSATGSVLFRQNDLKLWCDRAMDYPESARIDLDGNVHIKGDALEIYGDKGVYYPDEEAGELVGNLRARIVRDDLRARAKRSAFNQKKNELWLYDDAIAWQRGHQISGDIIRVHTREVHGSRKVDEIQVHGHAFFASRDTLSTTKPLFDQLSGEHMLITLDEASRLTGVTVTTGARSLYHIYDDKKQPSGVNFTGGDVLRMFFKEGKLSRIRATGNALGKQYPNVIREDKALDLPDFRWRESERPEFR